MGFLCVVALYALIHEEMNFKPLVILMITIFLLNLFVTKMEKDEKLETGEVEYRNDKSVHCLN